RWWHGGFRQFGCRNRIAPPLKADMATSPTKGTRMNIVPSTLAIVTAVGAMLLGPGAAIAKDYTMVSIPKLRATWFDRLEAGLKKAGDEHKINVSQQAPASADEAQQVRLIEDA